VDGAEVEGEEEAEEAEEAVMDEVVKGAGVDTEVEEEGVIVRNTKTGITMENIHPVDCRHLTLTTIATMMTTTGVHLHIPTLHTPVTLTLVVTPTELGAEALQGGP